MGNDEAAIQHLSAAIQILQSSKKHFLELGISSMAPLYDVTFRLAALGQVMFPYSKSFLYGPGLPSNKRPFWITELCEYWRIQNIKHSMGPKPNPIILDVYGLNDYVLSRYKFVRLMYGDWQSEAYSRDELIAFHEGLVTWKTTSRAIYAAFSNSDKNHADLSVDFPTLTLPPEPLYCVWTVGAIHLLVFNAYLSGVLARVAATDEEPINREIEVFNVVYQSLRIAAGLMKRAIRSTDDYKFSDSLNIGVSALLFHSARLCFSVDWQLWTIAALHSIRREGLCDAHAFANTLEILCRLEQSSSYRDSSDHISPLGPICDRIVPVLMPREGTGKLSAQFLRYRGTKGERELYIVARATWKRTESGDMQDLELHTYDSAGASPHLRIIPYIRESSVR
jgi:hypothetical protein